MRAKKTMFEATVDECVGDEGNDDSLLLALGYELTTDILVRLPVKSLFRLKCASKRWLRLISDPFFGRVYTKSSPAAMKLITTATGFYQQFTFDPSEIKSCLDEQIYFYPFIRTAAIANGAELEDNCDNVVGHSHTLSFLGLKRTILLSSSKGLLLCSDSRSKFEKIRYFVCNPITKQWVTLPEPLYRGRCLYVSPHLHCYNDEYDNLGEEGLPNKFVVVLFMLDFFAPYNMLRSVETFSSETGRWRVSSDSIPDPTSRFVSIHPCWGIFDWMAYWVNTDGKIVAYDLKKETLEFLPRAPGSQHMDLGCFGAFSLLSNGSRLHYAESDDANLRIWVLLGDESGRTSEWSLKHTVSLQCLVDNNPRVIKRAANYRNPYPYMLGGHKLLFLPLAFHPYDPNVVVLHIPGLVVSCNVDMRNLELIFSYRGVKRLKRLNRSQAFPYTPTLWPVAIPRIMIETAASTSVNISSIPMPVDYWVNISSAPMPVEPQIESPNAPVPVVSETEQRGNHLPISTVDLSSVQREKDHLKISGSMLTPIGMREEDEGEKAGEEDE